jgi:hypothetical protein
LRKKKNLKGEVTKEWRNYNIFFADKGINALKLSIRLGTKIFSLIVAKIKSKSIKDDVRFQMKQLLYETGKKEREKSKIRKKKEQDWLNKA